MNELKEITSRLEGYHDGSFVVTEAKRDDNGNWIIVCRLEKKEVSDE